MTSSSEFTHILAVDIGTTTIRSIIYKADKCEKIFDYSEEVKVTYKEDTVEMEPCNIWAQFQHVVKKSLEQAPSDARLSIAFCTQRNSFLTYDPETLVPTSKIICWNDMRSKGECDRRNQSISLKALHAFGAIALFVTRMPRFKATRILTFIGAMVSFRVMVTMKDSANQKLLNANKKVGYACLDSWLLLKLTGGKLLRTEPSNCSATGLYDPFIERYNHFVLNCFVNFPTKILVPIEDSATTGRPFCHTDEDIFGVSLPVHAVLADQQAALFGTAGIHRGDTMISMGTGTFLQRNLGSKPHASMNGLYPLVAWKVDGKTTHIAEGQQHYTSALIKYAFEMGYFKDVAESSSIAEKAPPSAGLFFIPAMGGLQTPYNNDLASCIIIGIKTHTTKPQLLRALLQSIAFRVVEIYNVMVKEIVIKDKTSLRICGGISNNNFIVQTISTLLDRPIERIVDSSFAAARGVALMAGISIGAWKMEDIPSMVSVERVFTPKHEERVALQKIFQGWQKAVQFSQGYATE